MSGAALAQAAEDLIGTRFRLHGRDPAHGLDCIGLLGAALAAIGRPIPLPNGYPLRALSVESLLPDPDTLGLVETEELSRPGDIALVRSGPCQFHLVIAANGGGFIHAHAGLRRIVRSAELPGPAVHHWRLAD